MELKQLNFFVTTVKCGGVNKAAEQLYTSQPNVSKTIASLERELGCPLFTRTSKGMELTPEGRKLWSYARSVLKNVDIMTSIAQNSAKQVFSISSYPSKMIAKVYTDYYNLYKEPSSNFEFLEGTTENIIENVEKRQSEIGIAYISGEQMGCFGHLLWHKRLEFQPICYREACIYAGKKHPLYHRESVEVGELKDLRFIQPVSDSFSMEQHLEPLDPAMSCFGMLNQVATTNSDNALLSFLSNTDLCCFGVYLPNHAYEETAIRAIRVKGSEKNLQLGYIKRQSDSLTEGAQNFITMLKAAIESSDLL
ncbi:LysR family transcriptional regulator [Oscillospiraceae bacterium MB08-C2-2]|nr:LysR family transcriptional regulator [Oscillospiraceae bacterium MB08-C2-2]